MGHRLSAQDRHQDYTNDENRHHAFPSLCPRKPLPRTDTLLAGAYSGMTDLDRRLNTGPPHRFTQVDSVSPLHDLIDRFR